MIYAAFMALLLIPRTRVVQLPDAEIVRRSNFVIAATVDGFVCYGTKLPRAVRCHRAVKFDALEDWTAHSNIDHTRLHVTSRSAGLFLCSTRTTDVGKEFKPKSGRKFSSGLLQYRIALCVPGKRIQFDRRSGVYEVTSQATISLLPSLHR